jgi:hypothetical protein
MQGFLKFKKAQRDRSSKYLPHKLASLLLITLIVMVGWGQGIIRVGYAVLSSDAGSPLPAAAALLQATNANGVLISETCIKAVPPVQSGLLFIDESQTRTGLVLVNPSELTVNVALSLRDATGAERSRRVVPLASHHQLSEFTFELFGPDATNLKGTVVFQSDAPIVVAALRQNLDARGEGVYTVVPVVLPSTNETGPQIIPVGGEFQNMLKSKGFERC